LQHAGRIFGALRATYGRAKFIDVPPLPMVIAHSNSYIDVQPRAEEATLRLHAVVVTPRGEDLHVISFRKANEREVKRYGKKDEK
jgi:hypothetical protein